MWTKGEIISEAYAELALAGFDFDLSPEEMQAAGRRLDLQMATWAAAGMNLAYAFSASTDVDLTQNSNLPLRAVEAAYMGLAVRIAAGKGKALAQSTKSNAKNAYDALASSIARSEVTEQVLRAGTPRGAGSKPWRTVNSPFVATPDTAPLQIADDGGLSFS